VEKRLLMVHKRSGTTETFDRDKIIRGLRTACRKRPVTLEWIEETATDIERELLLRGESGPVQSHEIGRMILDKLLTVDHVAYVRFASVYRQFQSIEEFRAELERLAPQAASKPRPVGDANASPMRVPWGQLTRLRQPDAGKPEGPEE
jgi:transcriptional repressor NrdR